MKFNNNKIKQLLEMGDELSGHSFKEDIQYV